jgi:hypothetical protein
MEEPKPNPAPFWVILLAWFGYGCLVGWVVKLWLLWW